MKNWWQAQRAKRAQLSGGSACAHLVNQGSNQNRISGKRVWVSGWPGELTPLGQTDTEKQKPVPWALLQTSQTECKPYEDRPIHGERPSPHFFQWGQLQQHGLAVKATVACAPPGSPERLAISNVSRNLTEIARSHHGTYPGIRVEFFWKFWLFCFSLNLRG